jgi:hypothetical protein
MVGELSVLRSQERGSRIFADKLETYRFRAAQQALNCNKSQISIDWCCSIALPTCIHICTQKTIEVRCLFPPLNFSNIQLTHDSLRGGDDNPRGMPCKRLHVESNRHVQRCKDSSQQVSTSTKTRANKSKQGGGKD